MVVAEMTCTSARRAHHARLPGAVERGAARRLEAHRRLRAPRDATRRSRCSSAMPAPRRSTNEPWVGAGADRPLAHGNWPLIAPSPLPYLADGGQVPRAMTRADMDRVRDDFVALDALRRRSRLRLAGAALRPRLPAVVVHLAADQPARRCVRRRAREPPALPARGLRRGARGVAAGQADLGAHLGARLGRGRHHARRRGRDRARLQGRGRRHDRLLLGPGQRRAEADLRPHVPDAVRRPHPQRGRHRDHRRRRDQRGRPRQQHHLGRPRRPVRHRPAAPGQPGLDADRGREDRLHRRRLAAAVPERQGADGSDLPARAREAGKARQCGPRPPKRRHARPRRSHPQRRQPPRAGRLPGRSTSPGRSRTASASSR